MYIIRSEAGQPLREELARSPEKILANAFPQFVNKVDESVTTPPTNNDGNVATENFGSSSTAAPNADSYFQGLALISAMVKLVPDWLQANRVVFDTLVLLWKSPERVTRLQNEQDLNLEQVKSCILFTPILYLIALIL